MSDATRLTDKVVIITGGAGGIGAATARLMAARGATMIVADIAEEKAREVAQDLPGGFGVKVDLADEASIRALVAGVVERCGRIDVLLNNAAALDADMAPLDADIERMQVGVWDRTFAVNLRGAMIAAREALPHLRATRGCIVNTVSNLALQGHIIQAAYSSSKAALIQLTRSIAASHARHGVRCNAVAPGMTMTPALKSAFPPHLRKIVEDETLREQLGEPDDIAEAIAFLASDAARNITGQVLVADGGASSHVPGFTAFSDALTAL